MPDHDYSPLHPPFGQTLLRRVLDWRATGRSRCVTTLANLQSWPKKFVLAQWRNHANFFGQLCRRRLWLDKGRRAYIRYALYSLPPSPACTPFLLALAYRPCLACPSQLPKQSFVMANFQSSHVGGRLRRSRRKPHFVRGVSLTLSFTHSFDPTSLLPFDLSRHSDRLGRPHATRTGKSCQTSINTSREG